MANQGVQLADVSHKEDVKMDHEAFAMEADAKDTNFVAPRDPKETARMLRKIDWRLIPPLTLLYLLSYLDRGNIGNAKIAGMDTELGLSPAQYRMALTVFFIPYAFLEVPSNMVLKIMRPSRWIAFLVVAWGIVVTMTGLTQNYGGIVACRVLLGVFEAGFFPASTYLLGEWYCRFELQWRLSLFFSAASMAGGFSGLLAFALEKMDGLGGLSGWRWIFIMEGIVTVVVGAAVPWVLPDSPASAHFLTPEEKVFIKTRLEEDSGTSSGRVQTAEPFQWKFVTAALLDWKLWFSVLIFWGNTIPIYGFILTAPTIINQLGYTAAQAQLLTIPIYFVGMLSTLIISWFADGYKTRWVFIVGPYSVALLAFVALLSIPHPQLPGLTYGILFMIPAGAHPSVITLVSWVSNNTAPSWKRAVAMALAIGMGNLGGAVASNIYMAHEAPRYWTGYGVSFACLAIAICAAFILRFAYAKSNQKRDRMSESEIRAKYSEQELLDMGDKSPLYRYVL